MQSIERKAIEHEPRAPGLRTDPQTMQQRVMDADEGAEE
jgi:hypothetical protein